MNPISNNTYSSYKNNRNGKVMGEVNQVNLFLE